MRSNILEVSGSAILLGKEVCALEELASFAARALRRIGAVKVRDVVVPDIAEPSENKYELGFLNERKRM